MASSSSTDVEIVVQLKSSTIHSTTDVQRTQGDELTSETQPRKKRKIKMQVPESLKRELMPPKNSKELKQFVLFRVPILSWLWSYQPKFLIGDITAGITISIMHISEGMAYASLAELPPVYGLYTSFLIPMIYAVFGTSRHVSVGTLAVGSLLVGDAVRRILDANPSLCLPDPMVTNTSTDAEYTATNDQLQFDYPDCPATIDIAVTMTFVYAMFMLIFGLLRLGAVTIFLSEPLISGFLTGAVLHLITSQLRHIVGVPSSAIKVNPGVFALQRTWVKLVIEVVSGRLNWATVIISAICIIFLVLMQVISAQLWKLRCYKKLPMPIPSQLIAVIVATLISKLMKLNKQYNIDILGELPTGLPPLTTPKASYLTDVIADAAFIAILIFYADMTVEKVFAKKHGYTIYPNQELFAFGIMNCIGAFFSCYISSLALSRSIVQDMTGGKTQAVAFVSSSILLVILLALAPLFEHLPRAILSSIIIVALQGMFMKAKDVKKYYQLSIPDMFIWIVTFLITVFLGVALGLVVGAGFGMLLIVVRTVVPASMSLGKGKDLCSYSEDGNKIPGVLIFRFIAPFCYTNSQLFVSRLSAACNTDPEKCNKISGSQPGCIEIAYHKLRNCKQNTGSHENDNNVCQLESQPAIVTNGDVCNGNLNIQGNCNGSLEKQKSDDNKDQLSDLRYIIIDMAPVTFIDSCGSKMLERVRSDYSSCGIQLVLAATSKHNIETLEYSGFVDSLGVQWFLPSIQAAVDYVKKQQVLNTQIVTKC